MRGHSRSSLRLFLGPPHDLWLTTETYNPTTTYMQKAIVLPGYSDFLQPIEDEQFGKLSHHILQDKVVTGLRPDFDGERMLQRQCRDK